LRGSWETSRYTREEKQKGFCYEAKYSPERQDDVSISKKMSDPIA